MANRMNNLSDSLPDVQIEYLEGADILQIHTGDTSGEAETIGDWLYIYRNKDDEVVGFSLLDASYHLQPLAKAIRARQIDIMNADVGVGVEGGPLSSEDY